MSEVKKARVCYYFPVDLIDWIKENAKEKEMNNGEFVAWIIGEYERMKSEPVTVHKIINERGAGRKPKLSAVLIEQINTLKTIDGLSQRQISKRLNISLGLVNRALNTDM